MKCLDTTINTNHLEACRFQGAIKMTILLILLQWTPERILSKFGAYFPKPQWFYKETLKVKLWTFHEILLVFFSLKSVQLLERYDYLDFAQFQPKLKILSRIS